MAKKYKKSESDGAYLLKLTLYLIIGSQWLWVVDAGLTRQIPIPIGLIIGLVFASHDHFRMDRKVEYALLLVAMLIGFWSRVGFQLIIL